MTEGKTGARIRILTSALIFMFAALTTRMWFLQVLAAEEYGVAANDNRVQVVPEPAPRGRILDRNGNFLVESQTRYVVTVKREEVRNREKLLLDLSGVLGLPADELGKRLDDQDYGPFEPVPVAIGVEEEDIHFLEEHYREFPGVDHTEIGIRKYPEGSLGAHVLGYLGEINQKELNDTVRFRGYQPGQVVGRGGVEQRYEWVLHGINGERKIQVDARGERKGELAGSERKPPVPGDDLVLTIDRKVQRIAEDALREGVKHARGVYHEDSGKYLKAGAGAVIVMNPRNGEILAMASYPTYDPQVFLEGLTFDEWNDLNKVKSNYPLNNRATQSSYPPGSTLKPFVAAAAVRSGYASVNGFYPCPSEFKVPGDTSNTVFHNWKDTDQGPISFSEALAQSCDTVFYKFGLEFYRDRKVRGELLQQHLSSWGFGERTRIDLPETRGRVPNATWKAQINKAHPNLFPDPVWYPGDTINMSIGQGDYLATPLQMAAAFGAIGNGGRLYRPHVGKEVRNPDGRVTRQFAPALLGEVPYRPRLLNRIRAALQGVVSHGTAGQAFIGFPLSRIPVAGKTGTSEVPKKQPHSWFIAMAPAGSPDYVVVSVVEEGGHGSEVAAPIVRRILEEIYDLDPTPFRQPVASD